MLATLSKTVIDGSQTWQTGIIGKSISEVQAIDWYQKLETKQNLMFVSDFNGKWNT